MVNLQIPEELDTVLQSAAERAGRTKEELAQDILAAHLEDDYVAQATFTDGQMARFRRSIDQLDRGEVVTSEQVDARFKAFFDRTAAR